MLLPTLSQHIEDINNWHLYWTSNGDSRVELPVKIFDGRSEETIRGATGMAPPVMEQVVEVGCHSRNINARRSYPHYGERLCCLLHCCHVDGC